MKNFYAFLVLLLVGHFSFGQITENFDTGLSGSYTTGSQTLTSGTWETVQVITEAPGDSRGGTGSAARINDDEAGASITTPTLSGAGVVSFWYRELTSGGGTFALQTSTDGTNYTTQTTQAFSGTTYTQFTYTLNDTSSNLTIRILNDNQLGHLIIDDFDVTAPPAITITSYPYNQDFESGAGGWTSSGTNSSWALGAPSNTGISNADSGTNAWVTNLTGNYSSNENSAVTSPIFDFSSLTAPAIQLSIYRDSESGYDGAVLQSSIDGGTSWQNVGANADPNNWFNNSGLSSNPGGQSSGWAGDSGAWVVASNNLTGLGGQSNVLLRIAFGSDGSLQYEGFAFDTISIVDVTCQEISGLTIDSFTDTAATISWTAGDTETDWEIVVQADGIGEPTGAGTATTTNPHTTSVILTERTDYEVYVRANCGVTDGFSNWVGPVTFTTAPSCPDVTAITIDSFTDETVTVSWTAGDSETDWEIVVQADGTGAPTGAGTATTANPHTESGLTELTDYEVYVRSDCDTNGFGIWVGPIDFTTAPSCPDITGLTLDSATDTTGTISWTAGGTETAWEIVVQPDATGIPTGAGSATTTNPHTETGLTASTDYEVYVRADCTGASNGYSGWVGPIDFTTTSTPITTFPYNENFEGGAAGWTIDNSTNGSWQLGNPTNTIINVADSGANAWVTNLTGDYNTNETSYVISPPFNFSTLAAPVIEFSVWYSSESGYDGMLLQSSIDNGSTWQTIGANGDPDNWYNSSAGWSGASGAWIVAKHDLTGLGGQSSVFLRAAFDSDGFTNGEGVAFDTVNIFQPACPDVTGITIDSFTDTDAVISWTAGNTETDWEIVVQADGTGVPAGTGTATTTNPYSTSGLTAETAYEVYVRADCGANGISEWVGPIDFTTQAACPDISGVTIDSTTDTTATISWTVNGVETDWEIVVQADGTGVPTLAGTAITNNPHTETGLNSNTAYEVYVRADCTNASDGFSNWVGPVDFTTDCGIFTAPYTENFENSGTVPDCWTLAGDDNWEFSTTGSGEHIGNNGTLSGTTDSGGYFAFLDDSDPTATNAELISPLVDLTPLTAPILTFFEISNNEGNANATLTVEVWDGTTWNLVGTYNTNTTGWEEKTIDLSGLTFTGPAQARFLIADSGSFYDDIAIDDVSFLETPTCIEPTILAIDSFTDTEAVVSWTAGDTEIDWEIIVQADGTGVPTGAGTATTTNPHTETGLTAETDYEVYVRANCLGNGFSTWVGPIDFTTAPACPDVTTLAIDSLTDTTANISWTAGNTETEWEIVVQADGTGEPTGAGTATTTNPHTETGLTAETAYEVYVRADCDTDGFSNWVGPVTFTTPCSPIVPEYIADMSVNVPDSCWEEAGSGEVAAGPGGIGSSDWRQGTSYAIGSSNAINLYQSIDREWLLSPTFDLSTGGPFQLEVNVAVTDYASSTIDGTMGSDDEVQLLSSTDGGTTWVNITTWNAANEPDVTGTEYTADLTAITGNVQFAIWASDGATDDSEDYDFHVGKFRVRAIPSCDDITGLTIDSFNDTAATLSWTAGDVETDWEIIVQADGTGVPTGAGVATTTNPHTESGLTPLTAYEVYVRADCGANGFSSWVGPVDFTTTATVINSFPYNEDFESGPGDWTADNTTSGTWELGAPANTIINSADSGANAWVTNLDGSYNSNEDSYVISPPFDFSTLVAPEIEFSIWWNSEFSYDGMALESSIDNGASWQVVGALGDPNNWYNDGTVSGLATPQDGWSGTGANSSGGWVVAKHALTGLEGQSNVILRVAFGSDGSAQDEGVAFDTVTISQPACPDITTLAIDGFTDTEAVISWTAGNTETDWEIVVQADGTGTPGAAGTATTTNPHTALSLTEQTAYEVYVRANCLVDGFSEWVGPIDFTTLCSDIVPEYIADMSTNVPDACWDESNDGEIAAGPSGSSTSDWTTGSYGVGSSNRINLFSNVDREWLLSPTFDLSTGGPYQLEMNVAVTDFAGTADDTMGSDDEVQLLSSTDGGTTWVNITTWNAANEPDFTGTEYIADLTAYTGTVQFAVWASDGTVDDTENYNFHIGQFIVRTPPTCLDVSGITIDSFTPSDVTVSWTNGDTETAWEVAVQADGTGVPTAAGSAATTNPHTEGGLTGETAYEVYVRADCAANGFSAWIGPVDFTTPCDYTIPNYFADMSVNVPDSCWDEATNGEVAAGPTGLGSSSWSSTGSGDDNNYGAGIYSNRINIYGTTAIRDWLISPVFDLSTGGPYQLELNVAVTNYNDGDTDDTMGTDDEVQLLSSTDGGITWVNLTTWNIGNEPDFTGTEYIEDLTAITGNVQFAIWASNGTASGTDYDFHVGQFIVRTPPTCIDITGLTIDTTTATDVTVSWTAGDTETAWEIVVQADGTGTPTGAGTATTTNPHTETGLTEQTAYEVYVRADCDVNGFSEWVGPVDFTTAPACPDITALTIDSFTATDVTLSWTVGDTETNWEIVVQADGTGIPSGAGTATTTNPHTETGLTEQTAYEVYVRANCVADGFSGWVGPVDFTTGCLAITDFNENFDAVTTPDLPSCWSSIIDNGASSFASVTSSTSADNSLPNGISLYNSGSAATSNIMLVSPNLSNLSDGTHRLRFYARNTSATQDIEVGTVTDPTDGSTFTALSSIDIDGTFTEYEVSFAAYAGTDTYIAIRRLSTSTYTYVYLDDIVWEAIPSCFEPSDITLDSVTRDSATLSWTPGTTETDWEVVVQAEGTGIPSGAGTATSANPYTETGLTAATNYEAYIRSDCGVTDGLSVWEGPFTFTTSNPLPTTTVTLDITACGIGNEDSYNGAFDASTSNIVWAQLNYTGSCPSLTVDTITSDFDTEIGIYDTDGNLVGTNDEGGTGIDPQSLFTELGLANGTYYIAAGASSTTFGPDFVVTSTNTTQTGTLYINVSTQSNDTVDFCNIQSPNSGIITEGGTFDVYSRIYQAGITDGGTQGANIQSWIGYSTTDATTTADFATGWTWVPATYNTSYGNDDEYQATFGSTLTPGVYYYASRFSYNNGAYAYGGINPGSTGGNFWNGTTAVSGQLTVNSASIPTTVATFNIAGCGDSDSYNGAYASATDDVVWVELIYDGNCTEITVDTESSTGIDTQIGLYDEFGNFISMNDDGGTGTLSLLTEASLPAGTYYIVAGAYEVTFGSNFGASTSDTSDSGTLFINASTPNFVDFCNLQSPSSGSIVVGSNFDVYAQIYEPGVTEPAGQGANIEAWIGYNTTDATTSADFASGWTWLPATYNTDGVDGNANNDEYQAEIGSSLAVGTYYYVSRFSVDSGDFAYGGINPGSTNGNFWDGTNFVSGVLTVNPIPEPTNHALAFTAVADSDSQITLTWNDNDGAQPADGFVIVGKTGTGVFTTIVDGTDPANDIDWSDDEFEFKRASGLQSYTVVNLNASTLYEFEIYPYTNAGTLIDFKTDGTIPSASATTGADPCLVAINTFPYDEGFESGILPACWSQEVEAGSANWTYNNGSQGGTITSAHTGAFNAMFYDTSRTGVVKLVSPKLDISGISAPTLSFWHAQEAWGSDQDELRVYYKTSEAGAWTLIPGQTFTSSITTWTEETIELPNPSAEYYIAFEGTGDYGRGVIVDDVKVEEVIAVTYTYTGTWSPSDPNGTATTNDDIIVASGDAAISVNTSADNVIVNPGASLTINSGVTLTVDGDVTLESVSNSYSSLMYDGTIVGTIKYERYVNSNSGGNDLISAPLAGETWSSFLASDTNAADLLDNGQTSPTTYAWAPFDKSIGAYVNYTDATVATLTSGTGYRAATDAGTTLTFTGTVPTTTVPVNITDEGPNHPDWNLVGNPYPSYINMFNFLFYEVGTTGSGVYNYNLLEDLSGIYGYDGDASDGYNVSTLADALDGRLIAPGQGFLLAADDAQVAGYDLTFDPNMRSTGSSDDFIAGRNSNILTYFKLNASNADKNYSTRFYFNEESSQGADHGYDGKVWGTPPSFALYSHLAQENTGLAIALQSLNTSDMMDVVIPLGVNANSGEQLTFTITESTLPTTVDVYLDDTVNNTSTLLNNGDYVITPITNLNGTGRFYLRVTDNALSLNDEDFNSIKIYTKKSPRSIFIQGIINEGTTARIHDIQGRLVYSTDLESNNLVNEINASNFQDGVYVVTLIDGSKQKSQKVIIR
ncbi:T9SS type A sorting domain-containing protein [Winogradskyella eximia]|uniref:T9SS type A sorting domain-containing protein n=1 Tax=Winogradskyella eximia TaxID=262006 RepID=UPI00249147D9|nr:T9SS type A sorting domain-containing protein [Winogradskyella eximia]